MIWKIAASNAEVLQRCKGGHCKRLSGWPPLWTLNGFAILRNDKFRILQITVVINELIKVALGQKNARTPYRSFGPSNTVIRQAAAGFNSVKSEEARKAAGRNYT